MTSRDPLTPVLVVARDRDPRHIADILSVGVDDYLIEPFAVEEFVVRVQSLIARARDQDARRPDERLVFDVSSRSVVVGSQVVTFSIREWNLLVTLLEADGSPLTATQLAVALDRAALMPAAIAVTISRLRRKLRDRGIDALDIVSTRGQGYAIRIRRP
jgi:DNA-binding response OmpR family regulator